MSAILHKSTLISCFLGSLFAFLPFTEAGATTAEFTTNSMSVSQKAGSISVPLKLTGPSDYAQWIDYGTSGGTAISGTHYKGRTSYFYISVTSDKTIYISIPIIYTGDTVDRTFSVSLLQTEWTSVNFGPITSVSITILGEPYHPPIETSLASSSIKTNQFAGAVRIPVKYTGTPLQSDVWVEYRTQGATATPGTDFGGTSSSKVHFPVGSKTAYISIPIYYTGTSTSKKFTVILNSSSEGKLLDPTVANVTIGGQAHPPAIVFLRNKFSVGSFTLRGRIENVPSSAIKRIKLTIGGQEFTTSGKVNWKSELRANSSGRYSMALRVYLTNGQVLKESKPLIIY